MTLDELKHLISKVTYKPKCRLTLEPMLAYMLQDNSVATGGMQMLVAHVWVEDVERSGRFNYITQTSVFHLNELPEWTVELFLYKVHNLFLSAEEHEVKEWLKLDGKYIEDPHPEVKHGKSYPRERTRRHSDQTESPQAPMRPRR